MALYVELYMDQGANFNNIINVTDEATKAVENISGFTVHSQMRKSYYSANATANIVCTITDAPGGEITLSLAAANTDAIKAGRYLFDVETVNLSNTVTRILEGIITVTPSVTKI